jgi:hypothetical protein
LKLNGTYQFLFYADGFNILCGSVHTIKKKTESLLVASKGVALEVNCGKNKYMVMTRDQKCRTKSQYEEWLYFFCKGGRVQIFGKNLNQSKFYSGIF